ncbi:MULTISPECIES: SAVED domain-containing protein [unclassified Acetobacterium]|jgi:hypothetical protein|uniref:SAVED domain-containing protein n=1 Tax=unclassified Acetobacterium TaxID=2638182 RepID=UPI000DBEB5CE|nr:MULTISPECIES: SAVED domain-containing protein [unclassified Acetobacterium]AWW28443.1 hypothetical protein DOZ58_18375 [Acetobacterium sp. KB-1]MDZ5726798.1 SAVED domain-containing protein [Acetobacterium sp. K1/6]
MGGKEASRGFLYQAFASVLEALTAQTAWDKIYIEFPTSKDKVDIALEKEKQIIKSIQVKSTINSFSKSNIKAWLLELIEDVSSTKYELFLIGQCDKDTITFINSVKKYYDKDIDEKAKKSLAGFDTNILDENQIEIVNILFEINLLEKLVRDSLHKYISYRNKKMTYDQISFISSATVNDQMISSTQGKGIDRKVFDDELEKRILLLADGHSIQRTSIGIKSFNRGAEKLENETESCLSLLDKFDGRRLKNNHNWNEDIYQNLEEFLLNNTNKKHAYQIFLDTHSSVAFAAGRVLDNKSGIDIFPVQKTTTKGTILWDITRVPERKYSDWQFSHEKTNINRNDSAIILNVTRNIYGDVVDYIKDIKLPIGRVINCTLNKVGATNISVEDGTHATILANSIYSALSDRNTAERCAILHIFASAPNAFMFFLGQNSLGFGKCILYEYDFELRDSCSYSQSIDFTK